MLRSSTEHMNEWRAWLQQPGSSVTIYSAATFYHRVFGLMCIPFFRLKRFGDSVYVIELHVGRLLFVTHPMDIWKAPIFIWTQQNSVCLHYTHEEEVNMWISSTNWSSNQNNWVYEMIIKDYDLNVERVYEIEREANTMCALWGINNEAAIECLTVDTNCTYRGQRRSTVEIDAFIKKGKITCEADIETMLDCVRPALERLTNMSLNKMYSVVSDYEGFFGLCDHAIQFAKSYIDIWEKIDSTVNVRLCASEALCKGVNPVHCRVKDELVVLWGCVSTSDEFVGYMMARADRPDSLFRFWIVRVLVCMCWLKGDHQTFVSRCLSLLSTVSKANNVRYEDAHGNKATTPEQTVCITPLGIVYENGGCGYIQWHSARPFPQHSMQWWAKQGFFEFEDECTLFAVLCIKNTDSPGLFDPSGIITECMSMEYMRDTITGPALQLLEDVPIKPSLYGAVDATLRRYGLSIEPVDNPSVERLQHAEHIRNIFAGFVSYVREL